MTAKDVKVAVLVRDLALEFAPRCIGSKSFVPGTPKKAFETSSLDDAAIAQLVEQLICNQ